MASTDAYGEGETRAFVAVKVGDRKFVVDLPKGELRVGSGEDAALRLAAEGVAPTHLRLRWDGQKVALWLGGDDAPVFLNGKRLEEPVELKPGDEVALGRAQLVVGVAIPLSAGGRRALTHAEFRERLYEEVARASRGGRPTTLVMIQAPSGDGGRIANRALGSFRAGDLLGTYAHDELEILLPDTPGDTARVVVERLIKEAGVEGAIGGLAVAPDHGDNPERLLRAARLALGQARESGTSIEVPPERGPSRPAAPALVDAASRAVMEELSRLADEDGAVLITGEVSSGKALFARLVHDGGRRRQGPFVVVSCASLSDSERADLISKKASATVARASGGTLVLDEVGDLDQSAQKSLVEVLSEAKDVRVIGTTHRALGGLVERGAFDARLHELLTAHVVELPPLRNRPEDIVPLAERFAVEYGASDPVQLTPGALARLRSHPWPGNVLELRNAMERAVRLANGGEILAEHLPSDVLPAAGDGRLREHVDSVERDAIVKALADANHNQTHAAKRLGISRRALIYKMEKYGLKPPPGQARRARE